MLSILTRAFFASSKFGLIFSIVLNLETAVGCHWRKITFPLESIFHPALENVPISTAAADHPSGDNCFPRNYFRIRKLTDSRADNCRF